MMKLYVMLMWEGLTMYCGWCGHENPDRAIFCSKCGHKLVQEPEREPAQEPKQELAQEPKRASSAKGWYVAAAVLAVVLVVLLVGLFGGRPSDPGPDPAPNPAPSPVPDPAPSEDKGVLKTFAKGLDVSRYETDYMLQMRDSSNDPWVHWFAKDSLDDGKAIGTKLADFDGDGADELLVVRWQGVSIQLEMYETHNGNAVCKGKVTDYSSDFPIKGIGGLDVLCDGDNGIDVQWWYSNTPVMNGNWWHLDRFTYDGSEFERVGSASLDGTGIYELGDLKAQLSSLGLPTDSIPDVDRSATFNATLLADTETSLEVVIRVLATMEDGAAPSYEECEAARKSGSSEWSEAKRLGGFIVTQKAETWPSTKAAPSSEPAEDSKWEDPRALVTSFIRAWYDDWSLDGKDRRDSKQSVQERCRSMVDTSSGLYRQLGDASLGKAAYSGDKGAATCVVEDPTIIGGDGDIYRVSLWYTSDAEPNQSSSTSYDWLVSSRRHEASWDVTVSGGKVTAVSLVPRGPYTLAGVVRVHEEDTGLKKITIVSMTLDEPVHFKAEYKGTYEGDAREVALETSQSDSYGAWSQYEGRRITVETEGLMGAYHDASTYNVDALVTGNVRLIEAEELPAPEPEDEPASADVVHFNDFDFVVPDAWRGKVAQKDHYGDTILDWNGTWMLAIRECSPDKFPTYNGEVESYQFDDGKPVTIRSSEDFSYEAEISYGDGKGLILYLFAYDSRSVMFADKSDDVCREYLELQAAVAGRSADDDPKELAVACLKACVEHLRF